MSKKVKNKKSKLSLVAMIFGIIAFVFLLSAIIGIDTSGSSAESVGSSIGLFIILPSFACISIGVLLNIIGYFTYNRIVTLISAIFYVLGLVLMPLWGFVGIPSLILQFIAFAKMKVNNVDVGQVQNNL